MISSNQNNSPSKISIKFDFEKTRYFFLSGFNDSNLPKISLSDFPKSKELSLKIKKFIDELKNNEENSFLNSENEFNDTITHKPRSWDYLLNKNINLDENYTTDNCYKNMSDNNYNKKNDCIEIKLNESKIHLYNNFKKLKNEIGLLIKDHNYSIFKITDKSLFLKNIKHGEQEIDIKNEIKKILRKFNNKQITADDQSLISNLLFILKKNPLIFDIMLTQKNYISFIYKKKNEKKILSFLEIIENSNFENYNFFSSKLENYIDFKKEDNLIFDFSSEYAEKFYDEFLIDEKSLFLEICFDQSRKCLIFQYLNENSSDKIKSNRKKILEYMKRKLFFIEMIVSKTEKNIMDLKHEKILIHYKEVDSNTVKIDLFGEFSRIIGFLGNIHEKKIIRSKDFKEIIIDKTRRNKENINDLNQLKSIDEKIKIIGNLEDYIYFKVSFNSSRKSWEFIDNLLTFL